MFPKIKLKKNQATSDWRDPESAKEEKNRKAHAHVECNEIKTIKDKIFKGIESLLSFLDIKPIFKCQLHF